MNPATLLLVLLAGQSPAPAGPATTAPERWVLHVVGGGVERVLARETADGFEVRRGKVWEPVPRDLVARAVRERDALKEFERLRAAAGTQPVRRVECARWAFSQGLLDEALSVIDDVLDADPDQPAARAFVARAPLSLTLPGSADRSLALRLVYCGARAQPAVRELAALRLADEPREAALAEVVRQLRSPSASVRAFAAFALRRLDARAEPTALVRRAVIDPSERVRTEAARALRDAGDAELAWRVAAALEHEDGRLRAAAARSLGEMGYAAVVPAIAARLAAVQAGGHPGGTRAHTWVGRQVAYVKDYDVEIAQAASIADPIVGVVDDATQLDVRVGGVSMLRIEIERRALCRALGTLTGEPIGDDPEAWLAWWRDHERRRAAGEAATGGAR